MLVDQKGEEFGPQIRREIRALSSLGLEKLIKRVATDSVYEGISTPETVSLANVGINREMLIYLSRVGWSQQEIMNLLYEVFRSSDELRIGVFGSMSRGKQGVVECAGRNLAHHGSDIDLIVITSPEFHEKFVLQQPIPGRYRKRRTINYWMYKSGFEKCIMTPDDYEKIVWVYDYNEVIKDKELEAMYRFMYGY